MKLMSVRQAWLLFAAVLSSYSSFSVSLQMVYKTFLFTTEAYRTIEYTQEVRIIELQEGSSFRGYRPQQS